MMKKILKYAFVALAACTLALTQTGCGKIKEIAPTSFEIETVKPNGMRSLTVFVAMGIHNPTIAFNVNEVNAILKHENLELGTLTVDPFSVKRKSDDIHHLRGLITVADNVSLFQVAAIAGNKTKLNECKIDVTATVSAGKIKKTIRKRDIPFSDLLNGMSTKTDSKK